MRLALRPLVLAVGGDREIFESSDRCSQPNCSAQIAEPRLDMWARPLDFLGVLQPVMAAAGGISLFVSLFTSTASSSSGVMDSEESRSTSFEVFIREESI